jgi:AraC-like DNA-binding protein
LAVRFEGRAVPLVSSRVYLIPPETDFSPIQRAPVQHFFVHFTLQAPYERAVPGVYAVESDRRLASGIRAVEGWMVREETAAVRARIALGALALVSAALSELPDRVFRFRAVDDRVERARAAIESRLSAPPSNPELAELAHMTPNALVRRFHAWVGESPQAYARRLRIERACVLLHVSRDSIDQIAEATGFCDRYHFTRVFTRVRGVSPAVFRKTALGRPGQSGGATRGPGLADQDL